jgi:protein gp37
MAENTAIEWADHTFNPWIGCTKVSPACDNCYAEKLAVNRLGVAWGPHAERRLTAESTWRQPLAWNRRAAREGKRARVFCASLADVFDNQVPEDWRRNFWDLIANTPHLDWLLLTKRPQNIAKMLPYTGADEPAWPWFNVWLGTTVENQAEADRRIPHLLAVPAARRFLSCEPLLGPLALGNIRMETDAGLGFADALRGEFYLPGCGSVSSQTFTRQPRIDWVIAGGESGPGARLVALDWFRSLRDQCVAADVPFFFKQWGEWAPVAVPKDGTHYAAGSMMKRVGKRTAGRLLDGVQHDAVPGA